MATASQPSEFETRRAALVAQIGDSLEQVLTQINGLNRGLEGIIEIGNEFASVEALWSQFEGVTGNNANQTAAAGEGQGGQTAQQQQKKDSNETELEDDETETLQRRAR